MRHAAAITERGMDKAFRYAKPGVTELEMSTIINEILAGGGIPRFVVVTAGERSALADAYATKKTLTQGDLVRVDVGCAVEGYWADTARTAVVGEPTPGTSRCATTPCSEGERPQLAFPGQGSAPATSSMLRWKPCARARCRTTSEVIVGTVSASALTNFRP